MQQVAEFAGFGAQVIGVVLARIHHQGHPVHHFQSVATEASNFSGVVGDQPQPLNAQV